MKSFSFHSERSKNLGTTFHSSSSICLQRHFTHHRKCKPCGSTKWNISTLKESCLIQGPKTSKQLAANSSRRYWNIFYRISYNSAVRSLGVIQREIWMHVQHFRAIHLIRFPPLATRLKYLNGKLTDGETLPSFQKCRHKKKEKKKAFKSYKKMLWWYFVHQPPFTV